ncbi:protein ATP6V1FNB [Stegostoma tigrinum]|uniref:protein ATP6V1FNB n=1 Tax=Stegostoma tigrinum TaxID=3053191 RepID=UPI00202B2210|nr:protein ATP6V1FNB [Stegostoma tigrinum]
MKHLFDTRTQKCWTELIEKEAYTRIAWKDKYGAKYSRVPPAIPNKKSEVPKLPTRNYSLPAIQVPKQQEERKKVVRETPSKPEEFQEMRPVTPQVRALLYDGFSKEQKGRYLYLEKRKAKYPEEKFQYPILSSWEYGWRQGDVIEELQLPVHGRLRTVDNTFYSRNGVFDKLSATDALAELN